MESIQKYPNGGHSKSVGRLNPHHGQPAMEMNEDEVRETLAKLEVKK